MYSSHAPLPNLSSKVIGVCQDITRMKEVELALKSHRDSLETIVRQRTKKLSENIEGTIKTIAHIVDLRDPYTYGHQKRVADISVAIAKQMGLSENTIEGIYFAALIHDVGKIQVPAELLSKPSKLTKAEFNLIKTHPRVGYQLMKEVDFPWPIAELIYQHHEKMNGTGYPRKLSGDRILLGARIIGVADVLEAMSSHRPYRPALGLEKALEEINKNKGILFDTDVVDACMKVVPGILV